MGMAEKQVGPGGACWYLSGIGTAFSLLVLHVSVDLGVGFKGSSA